VKPGANDAIPPFLVWGRGGRSVEEDVVLEGEAADSEQELLAPSSVRAGGGIEDDGDEAADVLNSGGLGVEVQNGGSLVEEHGGANVFCRRATGGSIGVDVGLLIAVVGGGAFLSR
jgi:hypothetical protein